MAASVQRAVDDLLECPICIETMSDTRVLPCIHTFCLACIQKHGDDTKRCEAISCPCCRRTCPVPAGGLQDLPKNILMEKLLEIRGSLVETNTTHMSQLQCCSEKDNNCAITKEKNLSRPCQIPCHNEKGKSPPPANSYCVECKSYMCGECWKRHSKQRLTGSHPVLPTGCSEHPEAPLEFYCKTCKVATCVSCCSSKHRRHRCASLSEHTTLLEREIETMKAKISLTGDLEREIETLKSKIVQTEKLENKVRTLRSKFTDIKILESENREMKSRIASFENIKREEAGNTERLKQEVERLTSKVVHTEELELETEALKWMVVQLMQRPNRMYRTPAESDFAHLCPVNQYLMPREVTNCAVHPSEQLMLICRLCGRRMCLKCYNRKLIEAKDQTEYVQKQEAAESCTLSLWFIIIILTGIIIHLLFNR